MRERDKAKLVRYEGDGYADGYPVYDMAYCSECNYEFEEGCETWECTYCPNCGQRLKWRADNEEH